MAEALSTANHFSSGGGGSSVTRFGDFLHFGQLFKAFGNNYLPKSLTFLGNFLKVSKSIIFD